MNTAILIFKVLDIAAALIAAMPELRQRLDASIRVSERAKAENRDPTPEEWAALDAETEDLMKKISK